MDPLILILKKLVEGLTEPVNLVLLLVCYGLYKMIGKRDELIDKKDARIKEKDEDMQTLVSQVIGSSNALAQHTVILQTIFDYVRRTGETVYTRGNK